MYNFKLYQAFKSKGYRAYQIADKANIEGSRFSRILSGTRKVTHEEKRALSKVLGIAQKDLF
jgi:transcriptional regulator with XRE-family HTH domain